jgi:hypothetical protein
MSNCPHQTLHALRKFPDRTKDIGGQKQEILQQTQLKDDEVNETTDWINNPIVSMKCSGEVSVQARSSQDHRLLIFPASN